jgi:hypothetical protein
VDLYTLDRNFNRIDTIDGFGSAIWTERYYGDSDIELVVPATTEMIQKLPEGIFVGLDGSDEIMIIETLTIKEGNLKAVGNSVLVWMNNRFVRNSPNQDAKTWVYPVGKAGWAMWAILWNAVHKDSPWLTNPGSYPMGIANPEQFIIPELGVLDYDTSGDDVSLTVDFGPVYDAMRVVATTYEIGMQIILGTNPVLGFRSYKGVRRTSDQTIYPPVRFSPQMDSLTKIEEVRSIAALKTKVYAFTGNPMGTLNTKPPGEAHLADMQYVGFDLRALMGTAPEIDTALVGTDATKLANALNDKAKKALEANTRIRAVDGEIVPTAQFQYGRDYNLGDIIEVQGKSEIVQTSRVIEYIRTQDSTGEKAYPTVAMLD